MKRKYLLVFILMGFTHSFASDKSVKAKPRVVPAKTRHSSLTTDAKFADQSVGGKYQLPMEALSVVENEKAIDDLIGVRTNFRDRVKRTKGMR